MSEEYAASVYARALLDAARDAGAVDTVRAELADFVQALAESQALRGVLGNPQIDTAAKQRVVASLTEGFHPLVRNVLQVLLERGRFAIVDGLRGEFEALVSVKDEVARVQVTSAVELTDATRSKIAARVEAVTGRRVALETTIDPAIVGGLVLRVGDRIVDGSVRSRIRQLRRRLATADVRGDVE